MGILDLTKGDVINLSHRIKEYRQVQFNNVLMNGNTSILTRVAEETVKFVKYIGLENFHHPLCKEIVPKFIDEFVLPRNILHNYRCM